MIPQKLQVILMIAIIVYFIIISHFLKNKALELKYTLIWLLAGIILLVLVTFPSLMLSIVRLLGIQSSMNGLYITLITFIIMILMSLTSIVSRHMNKTKKLIQEIAILEFRVRELEKDKEKK